MLYLITMKKLNIKFSQETLEKLKQLKPKTNCRYFMVGGVGRDFKELNSNPIRKVWKCDENCTNPMHK